MNWIREPLSDICDTTSGGTPSRKVQEYYQNGTIPWVKSGELENNIILDTEEDITEEALANSSAKIFPAGTLLIALYGATIGKLAFLGIVVPSLSKQQTIVEEIEGKLSVCDSIEQTVDAALQQAEAMRQSILKDAFEGRLL